MTPIDLLMGTHLSKAWLQPEESRYEVNHSEIQGVAHMHGSGVQIPTCNGRNSGGFTKVGKVVDDI